MLISELSFPHLQAEREARLTRELEQRRVVLERQASAGRVAAPEATRTEGVHDGTSRPATARAIFIRSIFRRTTRHSREPIGNTHEHQRAA